MVRKSIHVRLPAEVYKELQEIAKNLKKNYGKDYRDISVSNMTRMLVQSQLAKVKSTKNPQSFLDILKR